LSYGLNLTIPIFDRLQTRTNRVAGKVIYQNAILTRDNTLKSIKIDVQRTFKNYATAIESYQASLIQYDAAQLAFETQQESYKLGISAQAVNILTFAARSERTGFLMKIIRKLCKTKLQRLPVPCM
jgi:outer membrane protein TolC